MKTKVDFKEIAKKIINIKVKPDDSIAKIYKRFFKIMSTYGIKHGTLDTQTGIVEISNPDWTMCEALLKSRIINQIEIQRIIDDIPTPKKLKY